MGPLVIGVLQGYRRGPPVKGNEDGKGEVLVQITLQMNTKYVFGHDEDKQ